MHALTAQNTNHRTGNEQLLIIQEHLCNKPTEVKHLQLPLQTVAEPCNESDSQTTVADVRDSSS